MNIMIFHPSLLNKGGSQKYVIDIYNHFKKKHNVYLFTYKYSQNCYPDILNTSDVFYINEVNSKNHISKSNKFINKIYFLKILLSPFKELFESLILYIKFKKLLKNINFDIYYQHEAQFNFFQLFINSKKKYLFCYDTLLKLFSFYKGKKINKFENYLINFNKLITYNNFISSFNEVFVLDEKSKKETDNYFFLNSHIFYGYYNNDIFCKNKNDYIKKKFNLSDKSTVFLSLNRFIYYKNIEDIFDFCSKLSRDGFNYFFYLKILKDDERYRLDLINQFSDLIYPNGNIYIDYQPSINDQELSKLYNSSDFFVFTSKNQTWGNAILESFACGCIPIISDHCGISYLIKKNNLGILFDPDIKHDLHTSFAKYFNSKNKNNFNHISIFAERNLTFKDFILKHNKFISNV
jgi:glycosyltransferase involved in cell wall biosynthesis